MKWLVFAFFVIINFPAHAGVEIFKEDAKGACMAKATIAVMKWLEAKKPGLKMDVMPVYYGRIVALIEVKSKKELYYFSRSVRLDKPYEHIASYWFIHENEKIKKILSANMDMTAGKCSLVKVLYQ